MNEKFVNIEQIMKTKAQLAKEAEAQKKGHLKRCVLSGNYDVEDVGLEWKMVELWPKAGAAKGVCALTITLGWVYCILIHGLCTIYPQNPRFFFFFLMPRR